MRWESGGGGLSGAERAVVVHREALATRSPTGGRGLPRRERWDPPVRDVKIARASERLVT
jgi:hypothetical protein